MKHLSSCPVCGKTSLVRWGKDTISIHESLKSLHDVERRLLLAKLRVDQCERSLSLCLKCSFLFQNPSYDEDDLVKLYDPNTVKYTDIAQKIDITPDELWESDRAKLNTKIRQDYYGEMINKCGSMTILDHGGTGENLLSESLKHTKRYVYNFGVGAPADKDLIFLSEISEDMEFDFILHTHVLEHEPDPVASLTRLRDVVAPTGVLYLEIPFEYWERIIKRKPGAIWHVNFFNRHTLLIAAQKAGWECQSIEIAKMPYSSNTITCIKALFIPASRTYIPVFERKSGMLIADFFRFARFRLT